MDLQPPVLCQQELLGALVLGVHAQQLLRNKTHNFYACTSQKREP